MTARILVVIALVTLLPGVENARAQMAFLKGTQPNAELGHSIADAGDLNNDGFGDIVVGAPSDDALGLNVGRAFVWFGGPGLRVAPDLTLDDGVGSQPRFGHAVAGIGDVNNDGFDDIAVGAPQDDGAGADAGAVYVYFGGSNMNATADLTLRGETGDDQFGRAISKANDMNGDGFADWVVGAPFADPAAGGDAGAVYLFFGANGTPNTGFDVRFEGTLANAHFGWAVADVEGFRTAGEKSVLVGAPGYQGDTGRAYLFYGATGTPNAVADVTFTHNIAGEEFGYAVSRAGAFNNDAFIDIAIGAPGGTGDRGFVRVYYGESSPAAQPTSDLQIVGESSGDRFGASVADVGNFNGVGADDLAVGAPARDGGAAVSGQVYLFPGGSSYTAASQGTDVLAANPDGSPANDRFGTSVSALESDLDGDGDPEFLVGAPFGNNAQGTVTGIGAVVGSGPGVVPVADVPFRASNAQGNWTLAFGGLAARATAASLWSVEASPRELARLGNGLEPHAGELVTTLPSAVLNPLAEVELRFTTDGIESSRVFAIPSALPSIATLDQPWPNPFNPSTRIRFRVPVGESYTLQVFDGRGRLVRTLDRGTSSGEPVEVTFQGRDASGQALASGVYRITLTTDRERLSESVVLMK